MNLPSRRGPRRGAAPVPAGGLGASLRCQGIPGPCADVTRVYASVSECACLSARGSVPLKQSSAQQDPARLLLCERQRRKRARRGDT